MKCSLRQNMLNLDRQVPRYTSYPTAPHFKPLESPEAYFQWLRALPTDEEISLYIHVPYCAQMCWYCGCHTKVTKRYDPVKKYVEALQKEIQSVANHMPKKLNVQHLHFGGGSPGMLSGEDFSALLFELKKNFKFSTKTNIDIELDPRLLTEERVQAYAEHGVTRVSLGVQDFDDTVLKAVNRKQPFALSEKAVKLLRQYGINDINFDLLYGLPHQTIESMQATIVKTLELAPSRIALFGYAHVPWMKKHMRLIDENALPTKELRLDLFETAQHLLTEAGYVAIGIDHFAKADDPMAKGLAERTLQRNFQGYTTDACATLIGFGASAIGHLPQGYVQNEVNTGVYITKVNNNQPVSVKSASLSHDDKLRAAVIEQIMCYLDVDLTPICKAFGVPENYFVEELERLAPYQGQGFLEVRGNTVRIFPEAKPLARLFASVFDVYFRVPSETPRHAKAI